MNSIRFKIIGSLLSIFVLGAVPLFVVTGLSRQSLVDSAGFSRKELAQEILNRIELDVYTRMSDIQVTAELQENIQPLISSGSYYDSLTKIERDIEITKIDSRWIDASTEDEHLERVPSIENSRLSKLLKAQFIDSLQDKYGYKVINEIIATDRYGATVAFTDKTSDYYQADELWWKRAKEAGNYIGHVEFDDSSNSFVLPVSFSVFDEEGNFSGVYKVGFSNDQIIQEITYIASQYPSQTIILSNNSGELIHSTKTYNFLGA